MRPIPLLAMATAVLFFIALPSILCRQFAAAQNPESDFVPTSQAWTLDEAGAELAVSPRDPYLQFVALQLARESGKLDEWSAQIDFQSRTSNQMIAAERQEGVDLFSIFTGALAVQESLQLDTMRAPPAAAEQGRQREPFKPESTISLRDLKGPGVQSHPWESMLSGRNPEVSPLARMVPADFYYLQCRSLVKLLELVDQGNLWSAHVFNQAAKDATASLVGERLQTQLAVQSDPLTRPFYDLVVSQVAATGSDLFLREGSDLTLLFQLKQPQIFQARMDGFLADALAVRPDAVRNDGSLEGVPFVHVSTPDRAIHVYSCYPRPDLHLRSNSRAALARVLAAVLEQPLAGRPVERLGDTAEYRFIRTLMPEGAAEEDAFVYLSDSFVRHMVGPRLKLTERRRMLAYNHLRMIGHAAMLFRTQYGRVPVSLNELVEGGCAPGVFGQGNLAHPFGGEYRLAADGLSGVCSVVGASDRLIPCLEIPLDQITPEERLAYEGFVTSYNQYWRTFFDPIAIRIKLDPERYRAETIVLPLIDNSIYTGLREFLSGPPAALDTLPTPQDCIFSVAFKLDKDRLRSLGYLADGPEPQDGVVLPAWMGELPDKNELLERGLGDHVGVHLIDSTQLFDFNFASFVGMGLNRSNGWTSSAPEVLWVSTFISSLNSPVYISIPVRDAEVVDRFLERSGRMAAIQARQPGVNLFFVDLASDYYELDPGVNGSKIRSFAVEVGPIKWRFFVARINDGLYIASKRFVLDEIAAAAERPRPSVGDSQPAHALLRIRAQNWDQVLADYQLGWAENNRRACLNNLGALSGVARAYVAAHPDALQADPRKSGAIIADEASRFYGIRFLSPDGGDYLLSRDGKHVEHSLYGSLLEPRQPAALDPDGVMSRVVDDFRGLSAELIFLEDGLHAILTIDRQPDTGLLPRIR